MTAVIMEFLQDNGEKMEAEIATALHLPIAQVQSQLAQLKVAGEVICCKVTRFSGGKKVEGTSYRLSRARSGKPILPHPAHKGR
jgi:hypothetical protein